MLAATTALASAAKAQSILQQLVSPGPLVTAHAKVESKCDSCHSAFDKTAQARLCLDCHKDVAGDVAMRRGYHGRGQIANRGCSSCHTDHEGRNFDIVAFAPANFDHGLTDYPLRLVHAKVACASCHVASRPYRVAPSTCVACHGTDDPHKGQLGAQCQNCHDEGSWKNIRFDHSKTDFALAGGHAKAECESCHADNKFAGLSTSCAACHQKEEPHRGQLGVRCESCHSDINWTQVRFDHSKTKFALVGAHARSECAACHANQHYLNTSTACVSCHRGDDVHQGRFAENCASCHSANNWRTSEFDHGRTDFALLGKHADLRCQSCHIRPAGQVRLQVGCNSCHQKADTHKGTFGPDCGQCHTATDWKVAKFDHASRTKFPLSGLHASAKCQACHVSGSATARIETSCISCHENDDVHFGQLGAGCGRCHNDRGWKVAVSVDHDLSKFPLIGRHKDATCESCHASKRYRGAPVACADCHKEDDKHVGRLGPRCGDCHTPAAWSEWKFDHDTQTKFPLAGGHAGATCAACHQGNLQTVSTDCVSCHRTDDTHLGRLGSDCARCHTEISFRVLRKRF